MIEPAIVQAIVSGLVGGAVAGVAAVATIRVELRWLRRDVDLAHARIDSLDRRGRDGKATAAAQ